MHFYYIPIYCYYTTSFFLRAPTALNIIEVLSQEFLK